MHRIAHKKNREKIKKTSAGIATKTSGHAKGFPPSPLPRGTPPTPPFQKLRNVIEPLSGGLGGKPFAQHYSCPACFRCSVGLTVSASLGTIFVYESCLLVQWLISHRTRQQGGVVTPPESFAHPDEPGVLSPCGADRTADSRTCAT